MKRFLKITNIEKVFVEFPVQFIKLKYQIFCSIDSRLLQIETKKIALIIKNIINEKCRNVRNYDISEILNNGSQQIG